MPKQRRTGLFSATQTKEVEDLIRAGLRNPVRISVKEKSVTGEDSTARTPASLENFYMVSTRCTEITLKRHPFDAFRDTCAPFPPALEDWKLE